MNNYHVNLNLPVPFVFPSYPIPDMNKHYHARFHKSDMNGEFKDWIFSLGLGIVAGEFFYTPPGRTLEPHSDTPQITDVAKLNWMREGEDSVMDWYELKPDAKLLTNTTSINTQYSYASKSDIDRVHTATIRTPSLVNVGRIHGVRNSDKPRYVACVILYWPNTKQRLTWLEAKKIFQMYVV